MTNEEINVEVATKVMGWTRRTKAEAYGFDIADLREPDDGLDELDNQWWEQRDGKWFEVAYVEDEGSCREDYENGFSPTVRIEDDYTVLLKVRETWGERELWDFGHALNDGWRARMSANPLGSTIRNCGMTQLLYEPGDYSRAALSALTSKEPKPNG